MSENNEKLLKRIQKLLNLSKSSNAYEAAAALSRAQKLMSENNIEVVDVELSRYTGVEVPHIVNAELLEPWVNAFVNMISDAFGIDVVREYVQSNEFNRNGRNVLTFIGPKERCEVAKYCFDVLGRQLKAARREFNKNCNIKKDKWRAADSFCYGWVKTVRSKVAKFSLTEEEEVLIERKTNELFPSLVMGRAGTVRLDENFRSGMKAGENVQLHEGVTGFETTKLGVVK